MYLCNGSLTMFVLCLNVCLNVYLKNRCLGSPFNLYTEFTQWQTEVKSGLHFIFMHSSTGIQKLDAKLTIHLQGPLVATTTVSRFTDLVHTKELSLCYRNKNFIVKLRH